MKSTTFSSLHLALALSLAIVILADAAFTQICPDNLMLWNKLGSQAEIENSEVGLDGTFSGGNFVEGVFGQAYQVDYTDPDYLVSFPKEVVSPFEGCIEFWARIWDFPETMAWGHYPCFFMAEDGTVGYTARLNGNDGHGNGGLCGHVGYGFSTGTGLFGTWTYEQVLGVGQVEDWHHYALVWNENGIAGVADGTEKIAVFLDGQLESARWHEDQNPYFAELTGGQLGVLGIWPYQGQGSAAIDNIKIWSCAKTDFSDRFSETPNLILWNKMGSQSEIENSEVGLDGTFSGGNFVEGVFGQAYQVDYTDPDYLVSFPKEVIPPAEGCIEFWARIWDFPEQMGQDHSQPAFFRLHYDTNPNPVDFETVFGRNDGLGNGGLVGHAGALYSTGSGPFGSWTFEQVLGVGQVEKWHHYALVWNEDGIAGVADGTRRVAVFLDGQLESGIWHQESSSSFPEIADGQMKILAIWDGLGQGSAAIDNTKIWSIAKTSFCDRFAEGPVQVWHVPDDAPTVQAGINLASAGEIVCVACGTYFEHDIIMNSGVILTSETGQADCVIIDAQQQGGVMICENVDSSTRIEGLTLTGGLSENGGAISCLNSQPTIANCALTNSVAVSNGGGLYCSNSDPIVVGCTLYANTASAGAGIYLLGSSLALNQTLIAFNEGESIYCQDQAPTLACCDLIGNTRGDWIGPFSDQVVERGNFAADPCFCDAAADDLTLCADSFCLPGKHPWGCDDLVGAFGGGCGACDCAGPVSSFLSMFDIQLEQGSAYIVWRTIDDSNPHHYRLTARQNDEQWDLQHVVSDAGIFLAEDNLQRLTTEGTITYSLYYRADQATWQLLHSQEINLPAPMLATQLTSVHPNPFNPNTSISFSVQRPQRVTISIFDMAGKRIFTLTDQVYTVGSHSMEWDGHDDAGRGLPSGMYLVRMEVPDKVDARKISLIR